MPKKTKFYRIKKYPDMPDAFMVSVPDWYLRNAAHVLLVYRVNQGRDLVVAKSGRGGGFNLSFNFVLNLPFHGTGPAAIRQAILDSTGLREFKVHPTMTQVVAEAINAARLAIKRSDKHA